MSYDDWKLATPPEYAYEECKRDDSTECDCSGCTFAEVRFWREQGEERDADEREEAEYLRTVTVEGGVA